MDNMKRNWMYLFSEVSIAYLDISCHCMLTLLYFYTWCQFSVPLFFMIFFQITNRKKIKDFIYQEHCNKKLPNNKIKGYELYIYVQNFSVIIYFSFQLQCCGLISGYDISDFITISRGHYPITCCRTTLYDTTNSQISSNNEIDGQYCNLIQKVSKNCRKTVHIKHTITVTL